MIPKLARDFERLHELLERLGKIDLTLAIDKKMDCAPPAGEISSRFEGSVIGAFSLLNCHLEFLRG
jgi:hypothetical protein